MAGRFCNKFRVNDITAYPRESLGGLASIAAGYPLRGAVDALPPGDVAVIQMGNVHPETSVDWAAAQRIALPSKRSSNFLAELWLNGAKAVGAQPFGPNDDITIQPVPTGLTAAAGTLVEMKSVSTGGAAYFAVAWGYISEQ